VCFSIFYWYFLCESKARGTTPPKPHFRQNPKPWVWESVYPPRRASKGGSKVDPFFCLGHTNILKQCCTQDSRIFPPADPLREYRSRGSRNCRSVIACARRASDMHGGWVLCVLDSQHTYLHILVAHASFLETSKLWSASSGETLDRAAHVGYPLDEHRKGVAKWILLLGSVFLGHTNIVKQCCTQDTRRFPLADSLRKYQSRRSRNCRSVIACT
jgi:hypothetical protein